LDFRTYLDIIEANKILYINKQLTLEQYKEINDIIYPKIKDTWEGFLRDNEMEDIKRNMLRKMIILKNCGVLTVEEMKKLRKFYL